MTESLSRQCRTEKTMTRIYLIRHGEAEGNIYRRCQGQHEGRISQKGLRQIDALAERLRDERFDALYSSDLKRCLRTAGAVTKYHELPLQTEPRLRELDLGPWEDIPFGDLMYACPEQMRAFNDDPDRWYVEGAETFPQLKARIRGVLTELGERHDGQTIVCCTHGMAIRAFLSDILAVPSEEIHRLPHGDNTAVSLVEYENGAFRAVFYNDASHLPPELSTFARQHWWQEKGAWDLDNVRFQRLDPEKYPSVYLSFYEKTWQAVHGDLDGFHGELYLSAAIRHVRKDPDALVTILRQDGETVGVIELDTERGAEENCGWICLCFIEAPFRRCQLGAQLLGHAVSVFRRMGRRAIRLSVFEGNAAAIAFYREYGFTVIGETRGISSRLLLMEKELK